jgi:hypothetical protein
MGNNQKYLETNELSNIKRILLQKATPKLFTLHSNESQNREESGSLVTIAVKVY